MTPDQLKDYFPAGVMVVYNESGIIPCVNVTVETFGAIEVSPGLPGLMAKYGMVFNLGPNLVRDARVRGEDTDKRRQKPLGRYTGHNAKFGINYSKMLGPQNQYGAYYCAYMDPAG